MIDLINKIFTITLKFIFKKEKKKKINTIVTQWFSGKNLSYKILKEKSTIGRGI